MNQLLLLAAFSCALSDQALEVPGREPWHPNQNDGIGLHSGSTRTGTPIKECSIGLRTGEEHWLACIV